jgi:hypothetical protein
MQVSGDDDDRIIARIQERYGTLKDLLILDTGRHIEAKDCADAWRRVNSFMLQANLLKFYRAGNRHMVPRITISIENWGNLIPLDQLGYKPLRRKARLERNYLDHSSLDACRTYLSSRNPTKHSTHGISFGTGRKRTPPCMVGGTFYWAPGRLLPDFYLRASEVTKTLGADFHFLNRVIYGDKELSVYGAVPKWMRQFLGPVRIHLNLAFQLTQWFPLFDMISPGYPLNPFEHRYHRMCMNAVQKAYDPEYKSRWKPERRIHAYLRRRISEFRTDAEGRIISGPSFFSFPEK